MAAGDLHDSLDGERLGGRHVQDLVRSQTGVVERHIVDGAVVDLDRANTTHTAPGGDVLGVGAAQMNHAAGRRYGQQFLVKL